MAEEVKTSAKFHNIILENRGRLNVSGVEDVDSFDEGAIIIFTNMGVLTVRGEDLQQIQRGERRTVCGGQYLRADIQR